MDASDDPLSLLFVSQYFPPETGAAPTRVHALTKRWAEAGHDVTVLTSAPDYPNGEVYDGYDNGWLHHEERDGVQVYMTKTIPASNEGFVRRSLKFLWFMVLSAIVGLRVREPDVVVATSPQPFTGVAGWVVARVRRASFVFEVRDLWPESISSVSDFDNHIVLSTLDSVVTFLYNKADRIVVVSEGFNPTLTAVGVDEDRIWYHPNGVEPQYFERVGDEWELDRELRKTLEEHFVVSYVGTIGRAHGLDVVLDAAEEIESRESVSNVLFLLVGFGANAQRLEREASARGLNNVRFVGRRPKRTVPEFLELSEVALVHLKDRELFRSAIPSKMFEAMASGTPIAMGVRGEASHIVREGEVGTPFEPENASDLVQTVAMYVEEAELRESHGSNGPNYVSENFSWDSIANEYLKNLESLTKAS